MRGNYLMSQEPVHDPNDPATPTYQERIYWNVRAWTGMVFGGASGTIAASNPAVILISEITEVLQDRGFAFESGKLVLRSLGA